MGVLMAIPGDSLQSPLTGIAIHFAKVLSSAAYLPGLLWITGYRN